MSDKKTILLTGGAGYIGGHTALELIKNGREVVIADNYSNSSPRVIKRLEELSGKKINVAEVDVCDKKALSDKVFSKYDIGSVIHFAGYKAVGESCEKPLMYYRNNIDSTLSLLENMREYGVDNIVFSSSATVYGIPESVPLRETDKTGCTNPYGRTKLYIEGIITDAADADKDMSAVLLRYFNPIGADPSGRIGEAPNGIPNNLMPYITQVAVGKRDHLSVFGDDYPTHDGTGVRDYIHVVDLAKGHVKAIGYAEAHKGCEIFNLGTGNGYSVLDIVKSFERVNGVKIPYQVTPRRPGDVAEVYADTEKAARVLGWRAEKDIDDMCRDSWNWQKQNPNGYDD
ncbi:MAG: UDP-glucose 4-epimerase GalE [Clostridia bacterium]|nr:UDP-glucose 4-epimerase GalE [Clostridia bacterium]